MIINGNAKVSASDEEKIIQAYFVNDKPVGEYTFKLAKEIEKLQQEKAERDSTIDRLEKMISDIIKDQPYNDFCYNIHITREYFNKISKGNL
jgi:hypothetical protein